MGQELTVNEENKLHEISWARREVQNFKHQTNKNENMDKIVRNLKLDHYLNPYKRLN